MGQRPDHPLRQRRSSASSRPTTARAAAPSPPSRRPASIPVPPVTGNDATHRGAAADHRRRPVQHDLQAQRDRRGRGREGGGGACCTGETPKAEDDALQHAVGAVRAGRGHARKTSRRRSSTRGSRAPTELCTGRYAEGCKKLGITSRLIRRPAAIVRPGRTLRFSTRQHVHDRNATACRADGEPVLSLRGISKNFGAVSALTDIDLDVHAGEVVALVGDNGAGQVDAGQDPRRRASADARARSLSRQAVALRDPAPRSISASRRCSRIWRSAKTSTSSPTSSSAGSSTRCGSTRWRWRCKAWTLLNELSARIPSVRERSRRCRAASARPWRSPARCCSIPSSSCSTSRPRRSAWRRPPRC